MHTEAIHFMLFIKNNFPEFFNNKLVLDVGGGDINGNNRNLFNDCNIHVNDVCNSPNVTIVSRTKDLPFNNNTFDTIISTECFEHDPEYKESFIKIFNMLKPGGLFAFTCASIGRPEHGTKSTSPYESYGTISNQEDMLDYYKNLTYEDIFEIANIDDIFSFYEFYYNSLSHDLYFFGIKKNVIEEIFDITQYYYPHVELIKSNKTCNLMQNIFKKYDTDKNIFFHNYPRQYNSILLNKRKCKINLLEIGVFDGESLKAWKEYFINCNKIVGIDINPICKKFQNKLNNIYIEIFNASDKNNISIIKSKYNYFDIIIDDGSHHINDVIETFNNYFPLLNDGGIYIVEDTVCYKQDSFLDPNDKTKNHLEYFFRFVNYLNQWRYDSIDNNKDNCVDSFKINKRASNIFEASIDKIEFGVSYIAVHKKIRYHWL